MDRIDYVDLREALDEIARNNTFFHLDNDLGISIEQMERALKLKDMSEKVLIWVSYPSGIDCYSEREAFQKDTRGYNGVLYHGAEPQGDRKLAYAVEAIRMESGRVFGSLFEIDIRAYAAKARECAVVSNAVRMYVDDPHGGGKQIVMPWDEFDRRYPLDLAKMAYWRHEPDDPAALKAVIDDLCNNRGKGFATSDIWSHTRRLYDSRDDFYSNQIQRDLNQLREPNSADGQSFAVSLDARVAAAFGPDQLGCLLDRLPYKNAEFSIKKGQIDMQAIVPREEIQLERGMQQGKPAVAHDRKAAAMAAAPSTEKPSIMEALKAGDDKSKRQPDQSHANRKSKGMEK